MTVAWPALFLMSARHSSLDAPRVEQTCDGIIKLPSNVPNLKVPVTNSAAITKAMVRVLERGIVESSPPGNQGFFSNVFPILKKDGTARVILNLKDLNPHVEHIHFNLDTLKDVMPLISPNCFFMSVVFIDAFFLGLCLP